MNSLIESLNVWGARFFDFAKPIFWQSSLLMVLVFAFDFLLRRKIRPAVRHTLWLVVFVKLLAPPSLALPTGAAWWLRTRKVEVIAPHPRTMTVSYNESVAAYVSPQAPLVRYVPPAPRLLREAWILLASIFISALLAAWLVFRWQQIARCVRRTAPATGALQEVLTEACRRAGLRKNVRLRLTEESMSPAVCGLFRPVVLLPQSLIERLTPEQLRAVLLHELIHLRRGDVWVNCAQTLLQIVYWWHPLLWFANARVRRVREEAVDDGVMFALNEEAEVYAPTLVEVAKLAFNRPLASLGLVGILESRNALKHRIERLLNFSTPGRVGVSAVSVMCIAAFTALAVPMGEPPARVLQAGDHSDADNLITFHAKVNPEIFFRNVRARAGETMHTTNDNWQDILVSILDGAGVDCTPPRNITFNAGTGELSMQNTSEALQVVDEVVKELSLAGGERILNPPYGLKQVLIVAQFYRLHPDDFSKLHLDSSRGHHERDMSPWWDLSTNELDNFRQEISNVRAEHISSPRVQTSHGVTADLFIGDTTNNIELECVPYIHDGSIALTALARTTGNYAPEGGWPDLAGHTNCAIFSRFDIPDGGAVVLRAEPAGTAIGGDLVILLRANTIDSVSNKKVPFLGDLRGAGRFFRSDSNSASMKPRYTNGPPGNGQPVRVSQLVQDGKLLYQLNKFDEAETKLTRALEIEPDNQAALYYLNAVNKAKASSAISGRNIQLQGTMPVPRLYARTNTIYTSPERQKIYEKLAAIHFDNISFPNLPLSDVARTLAEMTQRRDTDQKGVYFLLNRTKPRASGNPAEPQAFDPATGQPIATPVTNDVDLASVRISLAPGLHDARLMDVLEAIVKSADHPIRYSLLDYGIEFSLKGPDVPELHTRTFKLDPNTFYMGLQNVSTINFGGTATSGSGGSTNIPHVDATGGTGGVATNRGLRYVKGLDNTTEIQLAVINFFAAVGVNLAAPKSVFFNARQGTLTVHATDDDLELIEQAINTLNMAPPEVSVKVRFVEAEPAFLATLLTNGPSTGTNAPWTGILTESRFKTILKALQKRENGDLLNEGEVTTLSGRQANFQVVDIKTIVSGIDTTETNKQTNHNYKMTDMPFGTTLDVVPIVAADGYTVQMTVTPSVTEFLGYEDPKDYVKYDKNLEHVLLPLPKYRSRQMTTSAIVWDGQTLVLANLSDESVVAEPNGAKLRQPFKDKKRSQLIIFITPTITDSSGNRVHAQSTDYYDSPIF